MHKIYLIVGSTGEYSDHSTWVVTWRMTREEAEVALAIFVAEANEYKRLYADDYYSSNQTHRDKMTDPWFRTDYTGTDYHIEEVADDARQLAEELWANQKGHKAP